MDDIINYLMNFGFSQHEADIYLKLLQLGKASGYKISKELQISKSTIYKVLDNMYKNGYIFMISGNTTEYEVKPPKLLFKDLEKKFSSNLKGLKDCLKQLEEKKEEEFFYKFNNLDTIKNILGDILKNSSKEIYINSNFNLSEYRETFKELLERNIRIILFSFNKVSDMGLPIEIYHKSQKVEDYKNPSRLMLVSDLKIGLVITKNKNSINAIYTNDENFVKIIAEHIHGDIYMAKFSNIFEENFNENIKIQTLHEKKNLII